MRHILIILSLFLFSFTIISCAQEMMVKLKRNRERIMSICLIGFLIGYFRRTLHIPRFRGNLQGIGKVEEGEYTG